MPNLYILRGLPGSGKSTLAKSLVESHLAQFYVEADQFFEDEDEDGNYNFDASKLAEAHHWCQNVVSGAMAVGVDVAVSNTFTTEKELQPYLDMAKENGYTVISLIVENRHGNSSVHGVPDATLDKMQARFSVKLKG